MLFRSTVGADLDRVVLCALDEPIRSVNESTYRTELAAHQYRPEWTWVAEDDGEILARGVWWANADNTYPRALDCLWVDRRVADRIGLAAALLDAAHRAFAAAGAPRPPEFQLRLDNGWRDNASVVEAVAWRQSAAAQAGLSDELERLQFVWTPDAGLPGPARRLVFRPQPDDAAFLDVFGRVTVGSLDTTTTRNVAALGVEGAARDDLEFYSAMPGTRDWWRLAYTTDGQLVGFIIPWRNPYGPNVGYLGVLPEWRGRGYIDEMLGQITRFHAAAGAERITATTDLANVPMAAAFERAGYRNTEARMLLSAPVR